MECNIKNSVDSRKIEAAKTEFYFEDYHLREGKNQYINKYDCEIVYVFRSK